METNAIALQNRRILEGDKAYNFNGKMSTSSSLSALSSNGSSATDRNIIAVNTPSSVLAAARKAIRPNEK
jgi:hypothetical protein